MGKLNLFICSQVELKIYPLHKLMLLLWAQLDTSGTIVDGSNGEKMMIMPPKKKLILETP